MFLMPSLVTMSIVATRIYRSLADFVHSTDIQVLGNPRRSFIFSTNANWATALPVPPNRTKASVLSSYEHWKPSASQTTDPHLTVNGVDELLHEKPQGPNSDNDPESNAGKWILFLVVFESLIVTCVWEYSIPFSNVFKIYKSDSWVETESVTHRGTQTCFALHLDM